MSSGNFLDEQRTEAQFPVEDGSLSALQSKVIPNGNRYGVGLAAAAGKGLLNRRPKR